MTQPNHSTNSSRIPDVSPHVEKIGKLFVAAWLCNPETRIEAYLENIPEDMQAEAHDVMIRLEVYIRASHGQLPDQEEYHQRFPDFELEVEQAFRSDSQSNVSVNHRSQGDETQRPGSGMLSESMGNSADFEMATKLDVVPETIGRYRVDSVLGTGGFGVVCLATDTKLDRQVALKFARTSRFRTRKEMDDLIAEARTAAQLNHPGIVAVHDVLHEEETIAIIQQFIPGPDLAGELKQGLPTFERTAELLCGICNAIAFAHAEGFIHRDLKPANILLNEKGDPHIADFGLAIHESFQRRRRGDKSGTPRYMSPELVRGESHRIDGRSDIWSIGVMMYEMLTGHRPFSGETRAELFDEIKHRDPKPPRQINKDVPVELERICLKCLSRPVSQRFATATDIAEDLRAWLQMSSQSQSDLDSSSGGQWEVIPRGLRSFGPEDADFFLNLLPGPLARNGLPDSVRSWKTRIESSETDAVQIALLYGPSGCGKSSFIQAGLIPHLATFVQTIRVEATATETEIRLIKALRSRYNQIPTELTLPEVFHSLREGLWTSGGERVLIVIDQFEQWLHNRTSYPNTELVEALRHCDGQHVQCLLTVRDDFWLATSRFLKALDVDLVEGQNASLVDLFDKPHARKVLRRYGRGYGRLEEDLTKQQEDFVDAAVDELADGDRVVCVRLSLFAEMFKDKPWTPATLKKAGGISGVGVAFLEETFSAKSARPEYRLHEEAARKVLNALLPDSSVDIRGNMRSRNELLRESGYANRPNAFNDVLRILDNELRLITPTDPEGILSPLESDAASNKDYYQLTHDYLVAPLRIWLHQKESESVRGRARLRLDERHATWSRTRENRFLPSFGEYVNVRTMTRSNSWSSGEQELMHRADRFYGFRVALVCAVLLIASFAGRYVYNGIRADTFASRVVEAETTDVEAIIEEIGQSGLRDDVADRLQRMEDLDQRQSLNIDLALAHLDDHRQQLWARLVSSDSRTSASEFAEIARALAPSESEIKQLWDVVLGPKTVTEEQERLQAATTLSWWSPSDSRWHDIERSMAETILKQGAFKAPKWMDAMPNTREQLMRGLTLHLADWQLAVSDQTPPDDAISLIQQYHKAWPGFADHLKNLINQFDEAKGQIGYDVTSEQLARWESASQKQANVASILAAINMSAQLPENVVRLMADGNHEMTRSLLIEQLHSFKVPAKGIIGSIPQVTDHAIRSALWMSLGTFVSANVVDTDDNDILSLAKEEFLNHSGARVHGAVGWLIRKMDRTAWLDQQISQLALKTGKEITGYAGDRTWQVNRMGQTMVKISAPGKFVMSYSRRAEIDYDLEVAVREITWNEFIGHNPDYEELLYEVLVSHLTIQTGRSFEEISSDEQALQKARTEILPLPVGGINWFHAAEYCNWLSRQQGLSEDQWCYVRVEPEGGILGPGPVFENWGPETVNYSPRLELASNYRQRSGYRMPLESEFDLMAFPYANVERPGGRRRQTRSCCCDCLAHIPGSTMMTGSCIREE